MKMKSFEEVGMCMSVWDMHERQGKAFEQMKMSHLKKCVRVHVSALVMV